MLYHWPILLVLTVICTTTTLIVIHLAASNMQKIHEYSYLSKNKFKVIGIRKEERRLIESKLADSPLASVLYTGHEDEEFEHQSAIVSFPDTPMPKTPLIRVMETINLSSTEGEHFSALQDRPAAKPTREEHCQRVDIPPQE